VRVWFDAAPLMSRPRHGPAPWARSFAAQNALNVELRAGGFTGYLPPTDRDGPNYPPIWSMGTLCDLFEEPTPFASGDGHGSELSTGCLGERAVDVDDGHADLKALRAGSRKSRGRADDEDEEGGAFLHFAGLRRLAGLRSGGDRIDTGCKFS
jgi:hypothetical protein